MKTPFNKSFGNNAELIEAEASTWLSLRDQGFTVAQKLEFEHWLDSDSRHKTAFRELEEVWGELDKLSALTVDDTQPDEDLLAPEPRRKSWLRPFLTSTAAAAALVALSFVGFQAWQGYHGPSAETAVGGFEELLLPDGSVVQLNTDSAVKVNYTETQRQIELLRGEAHFTVAKNPQRPFIVSADGVAVRALGTVFNVRKRESGVEILVTEGRVRVQDAKSGESLLTSETTEVAPVLKAGERVLVELSEPAQATAKLPSPSVVPVAQSEVARALAWQERRLEFEATTLADVVAEFNRYNKHKLVIADAELAKKRFGGSFRVDAYGPFIKLLETNFGVVAKQEEERTVLRVND